jgi:hypothetical protein
MNMRCCSCGGFHVWVCGDKIYSLVNYPRIYMSSIYFLLPGQSDARHNAQGSRFLPSMFTVENQHPINGSSRSVHLQITHNSDYNRNNEQIQILGKPAGGCRQGNSNIDDLPWNENRIGSAENVEMQPGMPRIVIETSSLLDLLAQLPLLRRVKGTIPPSSQGNGGHTQPALCWDRHVVNAVIVRISYRDYVRLLCRRRYDSIISQVMLCLESENDWIESISATWSDCPYWLSVKFDAILRKFNFEMTGHKMETPLGCNSPHDLVSTGIKIRHKILVKAVIISNNSSNMRHPSLSLNIF